MSDLDATVLAVASAKKYRSLCEDTIRRVAQGELAAVPGGTLKTAVKATKRRLHQIYGAFEQDLNYDAAHRRLEAAYRSGRDTEIKVACQQVLSLHQSTRERLPILSGFFPAIWTVTGTPMAVLDLGCGLNPVALPWMKLKAGSRYVALDIDWKRVRFLNQYLALAGREPVARCQDILARPPDDAVDVALLLKMSPTLERQQPRATARLIDALQTRFVVVSFSTKSLGGREKGMAENYQRQFLELAGEQGWPIEKLTFETELVFVLRRVV